MIHFFSMNKKWFDDRIIIDGYDIWCCIKGLISWLHNCLQNIVYKKKKKKGTEVISLLEYFISRGELHCPQDWWATFKSLRLIISVPPLETHYSEYGQHLSKTLPLPSRYLGYLSPSSSTLTGCLMEVALRQASFIESKCWLHWRPFIQPLLKAVEALVYSRWMKWASPWSLNKSRARQGIP